MNPNRSIPSEGIMRKNINTGKTMHKGKMDTGFLQQ
jgi:hypothetical protein